VKVIPDKREHEPLSFNQVGDPPMGYFALRIDEVKGNLISDLSQVTALVGAFGNARDDRGGVGIASH